VKTVASHGPVSVAVNALTWQFYTGGIIQFHCDGNPSNLNHVVQLVGYDRTASIPHYIARNSWGKSFGDNGYVYIAMGKNICGKFAGSELKTIKVRADSQRKFLAVVISDIFAQFVHCRGRKKKLAGLLNLCTLRM